MSDGTSSFSEKHAGTPEPDSRISEEIKKRTSNSELPCAMAFTIAADLAVPVEAVGKTADLMEYRLVKCQLGLFGYGSRKKVVTPDPHIASDLAADMQKAVMADGSDGRLACVQAWETAKRFGVSKRKVADGCEFLKIKINRCQLGAF